MTPYFSLGGMNVLIVDAIVIVILVVTLIIGLSKGFARQILSLLGIVAALALAIIFCADFGTFLLNTFPTLKDGVVSWILKSFGLEGVSLEVGLSVEQIVAILEENTTIPSFLHGAIANAIVESGAQIQLIDVVSSWVMNVISFVVIFVGSLIIFGLIKAIFAKLTELPIIGAVDKILGGAFSVLKATLIIMLVIIVLSGFTVDVDSFINPPNVEVSFKFLDWLLKTCEPLIESILGAIAV